MSTLILSRLRSLAVVLVLALLAVACAGEDDAAVEDDPREALREAIAALGAYHGVELVLRLDGDEAAIATIMEEEGADAAVAQTLFDSSIIVRSVGDGPDDTQAEFVVVVGDDDVLELRILDGTEFFVRVDVEPILALTDDPDARTSFDEFLAEAEMFGLGDVAEGLRDGRWIHLTGLEQMMNMFEGMVPSEQEELDEEEAEALIRELSAVADRFLDEDVTAEHIGSEDAGERVRVTTDGAAIRDLLAEVVGIVGSADLLGDMGSDEIMRDLQQEIPDDVSVSFDAWLSGGRLTQVALDLAAFADEDLGGELLLVVGIDEFTGPIDAPADAIEIDLFGLLGGLMGGMPGGDDLFGDDAFEDDAFEDDMFEDDGLDDDAFEDDSFEEECITEQELDEIGELLGEDAREEFEELIDQGFLELC